MIGKNFLPASQNFMKYFLFSGDLIHQGDCVVMCTYSKPDRILVGTRDVLAKVLSMITSEILKTLKLKKHHTIQSNKYWLKICQGPVLQIEKILTLLMDGLSHAYDDVKQSSEFRPFESTEGRGLCEAYMNLICNESGNLKP